MNLLVGDNKYYEGKYKILTGLNIFDKVRAIIKEAEKYCFIITAYCGVLDYLGNLLREIDEAKIKKIIFIIAEPSDNQNATKEEKEKKEIIKKINDDRKKFDLFFVKNLHAKIYLNEKQVLITSANFTGTAMTKNLEIGCLMDAEDEKISQEIVENIIFGKILKEEGIDYIEGRFAAILRDFDYKKFIKASDKIECEEQEKEAAEETENVNDKCGKELKMKIPLNVEFDEKDEAKSKGAQWDSVNKIWYLWDYKKIEQAGKWINQSYNIIVTERIYLVTGYRTCWKCNNDTKVFSIGTDKFAYLDKQWKFYPVFYLINNINQYSSNFKNVLNFTNEKFKKMFSKTINQEYLMNTCEHCSALQGDNFLYNEVDSVFSPMNEHEASNMTINKIDIDIDIGISGDIFNSCNNGKNSNEIIWKGAKHLY
jgi:hypothetical protein